MQRLHLVPLVAAWLSPIPFTCSFSAHLSWQQSISLRHRQRRLSNSRPPCFGCHSHHRNQQDRHSSSTQGQRMNMAVLEVEQKFHTNGDQTDSSASIDSRLEDLGFGRQGSTKIFTDWYFDDCGSLTLSLQDCWLRYREIEGKGGQWQLKRGQQHAGSSTTVYQEIEGQEAVDIALSLLQECVEASDKAVSSAVKSDPITHDDKDLPMLPTSVSHSLKPFAKFTTTRTSWLLKEGHTLGIDAVERDSIDSSHTIQVDLDTTDTSYAVGEVEIVVETHDQVPKAKERIQRVISLIVVDSVDDGVAKANKDNKNSNESSSPAPPQGKLEHFLSHNRPVHFQALVDAGIMK